MAAQGLPHLLQPTQAFPIVEVARIEACSFWFAQSINHLIRNTCMKLRKWRPMNHRESHQMLGSTMTRSWQQPNCISPIPSTKRDILIITSHFQDHAFNSFPAPRLPSTTDMQKAQLLGRQSSTYRGGWPRGFIGSTCSGDAPVKCQPYSFMNLNCCPAGQTCSGPSGPIHCCPDKGDCGTVVANMPVCANSTWNMVSSYQDS